MTNTQKGHTPDADEARQFNNFVVKPLTKIINRHAADGRKQNGAIFKRLRKIEALIDIIARQMKRQITNNE